MLSPDPIPHPFSLSSPYLTPFKVLIVSFSFLFTKNHIVTIYTSSTPIPLPPPSQAHPFFPLSAFFHSWRHVPPRTPLYLLVDHTQRSAPTNYITRKSANLTSLTRPKSAIYKSTIHLPITL